MQGIIGGIQIQDQGLRGRLETFHKPLHKKTLAGFPIHLDFLVRIASTFIQLQTIQGAFAGQGFAPILSTSTILPLGIFFLNQRGQQNIFPQQVVIVQILLTQGHGIDPLREQLEGAVFDPCRVSAV